MAKLHHTVKRRLEPFGEMFERMLEEAYARVGKMKEEERRQLECAVAKLTSTNCSWTLYRMREHITDAIQHHRGSERRASKKAQEPNAGRGDTAEA